MNDDETTREPSRAPLHLETLNDRSIMELFTRDGIPELLGMGTITITLPAHHAFLMFSYAQIGLSHPQASRVPNALIARAAVADMEDRFKRRSRILSEVIRRGWLKAPRELREPAPLVECSACGGTGSNPTGFNCKACDGVGRVRSFESVDQSSAPALPKIINPADHHPHG